MYTVGRPNKKPPFVQEYQSFSPFSAKSSDPDVKFDQEDGNLDSVEWQNGRYSGGVFQTVNFSVQWNCVKIGSFYNLRVLLANPKC